MRTSVFSDDLRSCVPKPTTIDIYRCFSYLLIGDIFPLRCLVNKILSEDGIIHRDSEATTFEVTPRPQYPYSRSTGTSGSMAAGCEYAT